MDQANLYNPECETISREELEQLQIERLQSTLNRVYRCVAFYRTAFDAHGVNLERIKDVAALRELPFTTKEDLQKSYPYDMFAVPLHDILRIHTTSGVSSLKSQVSSADLAPHTSDFTLQTCFSSCSSAFHLRVAWSMAAMRT